MKLPDISRRTFVATAAAGGAAVGPGALGGAQPPGRGFVGGG